MKSIGIVVCNFNKEDYVLNCVKSLFEQTINDFDIYVVDNASTDNSVMALKETFGDKITLLENEENLGGSGGFNTGLREVLKKDYEYIMCVDNDVVFDSRAVEELQNFLKEYDDVGMVGSCCYFMDAPERIWSFGADIDFERFIQKDHYRNLTDADELPEVVYCTFVPACSVMLKASVVREVGIMPEENFIYWDDIEWGYRVNLSGYKVASYRKSKVWHKGGGRSVTNTFHNYYVWRNKLRFFLKYISEDKKEYFADTILEEIFRMIYGCHLKGEDNIIRSVMYAFDDAVHGVTGKAEDYKILPRGRNTPRIAAALEYAKSVVIRFNGDYEGLGNIIKAIKSDCGDIKITIAVESELYEEVCKQYSKYNVVAEYLPEQYEQHLVMCEHIFKLKEDMPEDVYVDSWCNIIYTPEDFIYAKSFQQTKELFKLCKLGLLVGEYV